MEMFCSMPCYACVAKMYSTLLDRVLFFFLNSVSYFFVATDNYLCDELTIMSCTAGDSSPEGMTVNNELKFQSLYPEPICLAFIFC